MNLITNSVLNSVCQSIITKHSNGVKLGNKYQKTKTKNHVSEFVHVYLFVHNNKIK